VNNFGTATVRGGVGDWLAVAVLERKSERRIDSVLGLAELELDSVAEEAVTHFEDHAQESASVFFDSDW
jgi:hypothetical protein